MPRWGTRLLQYGVLLLWGAFALFPLYWLVSTSFKPRLEWIRDPISWFPEEPTLDNYEFIFSGGSSAGSSALLGLSSDPAWKAIKDSLILTTTSTILALAIGTAAAYAISRFQTGGKSLPFSILQLRMFPPVAALVPLLIMFSTVEQFDSYWPPILLYTGFTMPFAVWLMKSFIDDIPRALEEAAIIDGASDLGAIRKVVFPLIRGGLAATGLFVFIIIWSDFIVALTLTQENVVTLPVQLSKYATSSGQLYGPQAALATIAVIPVMLLGVAIQRYLVRGLTFGAVKR
jgi:multiple sugar transport system permease protein